MAGKYFTDYFTEIPEIKETLIDFTGKKQARYLYFRSMNTIFPLLFWRFKDHKTLQIEQCSRKCAPLLFGLSTDEANNIRENWKKEEYGIKIWRI